MNYDGSAKSLVVLPEASVLKDGWGGWPTQGRREAISAYILGAVWKAGFFEFRYPS
jgi:hypothetical protein